MKGGLKFFISTSESLIQRTVFKGHSNKRFDRLIDKDKAEVNKIVCSDSAFQFRKAPQFLFRK